jgi:cyclophilin family peptidyl-prolyl cis-trans isomerase/HEAT repeat protein
MKNHSRTSSRRNIIVAARVVFLTFAFCCFASNNEALAQKTTPPRRTSPTRTRATAARPLPEAVMLPILLAEDTRNWSGEVAALLFNADARIRSKAALAAGRIGDERALPQLLALLQSDKDKNVRAMAAFALGETEFPEAAEALVTALHRTDETNEVRARALEALGKVIAALPKTDEARAHELGSSILDALNSESQRAKPDRQVILLGLTAALRAKPQNGGIVLAKFLSNPDARIRADALNALARLRSKDASDQLRALLTNDVDAVVRANAARALGAAEDQTAFDALVTRAASDVDQRVRVSSIRSLAALKEARAAAPLLQRAATLMTSYRASKNLAAPVAHPSEVNELLEIATALSRVLANTADAKAVAWLREFRESEALTAPEIEMALARIAPAMYLREKPFNKGAVNSKPRIAGKPDDWKSASSVAQGLGEITGMTAAAGGNGVISLQVDAQLILRSMLDDANTPALAVPDVLSALAASKAGDVGELMRKQLQSKDVIVRAKAAELIGELAPEEANARALAAALPAALSETMSDATLATLDALAKQKSAPANEAIKTALESSDHIVRRRAVALLKENGAGDFSARIGTVATRNTVADYRRAIARMGKRTRAEVVTEKGSFIIELLPDDAPLTVDNFVQLAARGFFNNITFHRVVPAFVVQGGDPRGDGNGGPPYQIRCEINEVPYERGAVGMALSGKDTGGSQWFVTHTPQPHLEGGYTVFGRVASATDMRVVDSIVRGDLIRSINVTENPRAASKKSVH